MRRDRHPGQRRRAVADRHADGPAGCRRPARSGLRRRKQPLAGGFLTDPDEVAHAAIYFLSDESRAVTGQVAHGRRRLVGDHRRTAERARPMTANSATCRSSPTVDVCVVGAGSAGSTAAIAAARTGASVLLIDRLPFLGGTSTAVLDTFYGFYTPGSRARKVVGGIADDVVAALRALGPVVERPNTYGAGTGRHLPRRAPQGRLGAPGHRGRAPGPAPRDRSRTSTSATAGSRR